MGEIRVTVAPSAEAYGQDLAGPPPPELFSSRAEEIAGSVAEVAAEFSVRLDEVAAVGQADGWKLGQVEMAFGLQVEVGAGILIAKASAGATFTATLTWTR